MLPDSSGRSLVLDLSHPLSSSTQVYPGDPPFVSSQFATVKKDGYAVHTLLLGTHTGTHIDAPSHFFDDGATIDQISLSKLIGPCVIVDLTHKGARQKITWEDLSSHVHLLTPEVHLIIRTGWSKYWGTDRYLDHPFLTRDTAERLIRSTGVQLIGVDTLSPDETPADGGETEGGFGFHEVFLGSGRLIVENLHLLEELATGDTVCFMPLKLEGCDGSPIRAFALKQ